MIAFLGALQSGCSSDPIPDPEVILSGALRAIGGVETLAGVDLIDAVATGSGPGGEFETHVTSASDGRVRFQQTTPSGHLTAGIDSVGGWQLEGDSVRALAASIRTFIRGHELHLLALAPKTRLTAPVFTGETTFRGSEAFAIGFKDDLGGDVVLYYARNDTLPIGLQLEDHLNPGSPAVIVVFGHWQPQEGLRLFRDAAFLQGDERFTYRYTSVQVNPADGALLDRPVH